MHKLLTLAAAAAAFTATPAYAQSFVGEWLATAQTQQGAVSEALTVTKVGEGYVVHVEAINADPSAPQVGQPTDVVVDGDKFSFKRSLGTALVIAYSGTVAGESFTGRAEVGGFEVPYNGVRTSDPQ